MLPLLLLAAAPAAAPAVSGLMTAGRLYEKCQSSSADSASYCYAYVSAVYDSVRAYEVWMNFREICAPAGLVQSDVRSAFINFMKVTPNIQGAEAASVVVLALRRQYPCLSQTPNGLAK